MALQVSVQEDQQTGKLVWHFIKCISIATYIELLFVTVHTYNI